MIKYIKWLPSYLLVATFFTLYVPKDSVALLIGLFCAMAAFIFRDYMEQYDN